MISSKEVINYLEENLDKSNIVSMFVAGSLPEQLTPGSDLDIFIIMKYSRKNEFLDNLSQILNKFIKKNKEVTYSLFRGPIKYQEKGLIHIITYTDGEEINFPDNELLQMLKIFKTTARMISGENISKLMKKVKWNDKARRDNDKLRMESKYILLKEKGYTKYKEWIKTRNGWELQKVIKKPDKFYKSVLEDYYKKVLKIAKS